jgi:hypothetical protein
VGHVAHVVRNGHKISVRKPQGNNHLGELIVTGRIILKWILDKYVVTMWTGLKCLRIGLNGRHL